MFTDLNLTAPQAKKIQLPGVDLVKFLCALLVVTIHANPFADVQSYLAYGLENYLARLAVPFFFISGGYFCFRKTCLEAFDPRPAWSYAKKMLGLYLIWSALYLLPELPRLLWNGQLLPALAAVLFSGHHQLWYLHATVVAVGLLAFALRKGVKLEAVLLFGGGAYIIGLLGDSYFGLIRPLGQIPVLNALGMLYKTVFATTRNGLFEGLLFVTIGALFAYKPIRMKLSTGILGLVVSLGLMLVEAFAVYWFQWAIDHNMYLFLVPASFFLFYLVTRLKIPAWPWLKACRSYSSLIYFTHMWVQLYLLAGVQVHSILRYGLVLGGALALSFGIIQLQKIPGLRWLGKLY